jgi:hypothetical protein
VGELKIQGGGGERSGRDHNFSPTSSQILTLQKLQQAVHVISVTCIKFEIHNLGQDCHSTSYSPVTLTIPNTSHSVILSHEEEEGWPGLAGMNVEEPIWGKEGSVPLRKERGDRRGSVSRWKHITLDTLSGPYSQNCSLQEIWRSEKG